MVSRRDRVYSQYPEPVIGYELNPEHGEFSVVIPEATVNLIPNPSLEINITGYTAIGGARALSAAWQAYGYQSLKLTPAVSTESGMRYDGWAGGTSRTYTGSVWMLGEYGKTYYIFFETSAGAVVGQKRAWIGTGRPQRIWHTHYFLATDTYRLCVTRDGKYTDQTPFYVDALQAEEKDHPTTFCDGDQYGFIIGQMPYLWNGIPHASTSSRSIDTRAGGREVKLMDYGLRLLSMVGLGMMPLVDQSLPIPGIGELAQGTGTQAREFVLVGDLEYDNLRHGYSLLSDIYDAVKPELTVKNQPLILRYQQQDEDGDPCGNSLDIICKYRTGLEGLTDNNHSSRLALTFKQHIPYLQSTLSEGKTLAYQISVPDADYIVKRGYDGVWDDLAGGLNGTVKAMAQMPDGTYVVGGEFTNAGGVANADYVAKWDGTAFTALGSGTNGPVYAICVPGTQTGGVYDIFVGGSFLLAGGVANTVNIARWGSGGWNALSTGLNSVVNSIAKRPDGVIIIGGDFTNAGGVANADSLASWNGIAFGSFGTGVSAAVYAIAVKPDNTFYIGGTFALAGGVAGTSRIAYWNGAAFVALGAGCPQDVFALLLAPDATLYAGGAFDLMNSVAGTVRIAAWNGVTWRPLGTGLGIGTGVLSLALDNQNNLIAGGDFVTAGGIAIPDHMALWNGSIWTPMDIDLPGAASVYSLLIDRFSNLFVGFNTTGTAVASTTTVINPSGTSKAYPVYFLNGPGTLYQIKNYSTGRSIYFSLTFLEGETVRLILDPKHISLVSSMRGDIYGSSILPGSNVNFELLPGDNNISVLVLGDTPGVTSMFSYWQPQYNSLAAAVYK